MIRILALLASLVLLAACDETQLNEAKEDLGDFNMRVSFVYTDKALQWPLSRAAETSEWNEPIERALEARLGRYNGAGKYDVAITLEGFLLATGGIPVLVNPKSAAVVNVFVYDVTTKTYLLKEHQMKIFEDTTGESAIFGSGYSRTKAEQIDGLALKIVDGLEEYMAAQHAEKGWFNGGESPETLAEPEPVTAPADTAAVAE
ncbi:hypothetical protein [Phaeobacter sp. 11ANDIMAR09]|uniref:hypothetical protein n=1 Tax=Phaeobacter sp. 11ANDIMAR09 TaxID=1225647 RepID=UPI0006C88EDF|nr:hypothetical protein [Phaeobacter sp. 11ANDIMAR09]KPD13186.1 hypothetical protein AN476_05485 [Phaeobacter sp. 11ANDIMAR09]